MKETSPSYYAIIPSEVRYDSSLNANAKLLYGEITALSNKDGKCWANNKYFAELYGVSKGTISRWVSNLVDRGYVKNTIIKNEGIGNIVHRYMQIRVYPIRKNDYTPIRKNDKDNNTSNNNTRVNNKINREETEKVSSSQINLDEVITEVETEKKEKEKSSAKKEKVKFDNQEKQILFNTWLDYRKEIKKPINAPKSIQTLVNKFNNHSVAELKAAINKSIENEYTGLFINDIKTPSTKNYIHDNDNDFR